MLKPRIRLLLLTAALSVVGACSSTPKMQSFHDYNPAVDFGNYQSWSFISDRPMIVSASRAAVNPLLQNRIMEELRAELTQKGFRYVDDPENADFVVSFTVGSREQIKVTEYPASYQVGYGRYYRYGGYGMTYGTETRVRQYTEGQLAVDIFDVTTRTPAFHGATSTRVTESDRENPQPLLRAAVTEALKGFPPSGAGSVAEPLLVPLDQGG